MTNEKVAPLVGAWIEIYISFISSNIALVAPLVGAWIEISSGTVSARSRMPSLLSWERGLKFRNITAINLM